MCALYSTLGNSWKIEPPPKKSLLLSVKVPKRFVRCKRSSICLNTWVVFLVCFTFNHKIVLFWTFYTLLNSTPGWLGPFCFLWALLTPKTCTLRLITDPKLAVNLDVNLTDCLALVVSSAMDWQPVQMCPISLPVSTWLISKRPVTQHLIGQVVKNGWQMEINI